jgi:addiction module RelE/StbE family toxin
VRIVWLLVALNDRREIYDFIAIDNKRAADALDDRLETAARTLKDFPKRGRPGRASGTRELLAHHHYALIYQTTADEVHILAVVHTSRQWPPMAE